MSVRVSSRGTYQLFRNTVGRQVLSIDDRQLEFTHGTRGGLVARRVVGAQVETVLDAGRFQLIKFDRDDRWHHRLLLERQGDYRVLLFPKGLPDDNDREVICQISKEVVGVDEVDTYVRSLRSAIAAYQRHPPQGHRRFTRTRSLLKDLEFPATQQQVLSSARRQRAGDEVTEMLEAIDDRKYDSIDDLLRTIDDIQRDARLAGETLSPRDMTAIIDSMEPADLYVLEEYEGRTGSRNEMLQAIIRRRKRKRRQ